MLFRSIGQAGQGRATDVPFSLPVPIERHYQAYAARISVSPTVTALLLHDLTVVKRSEQLRADFIANASHELRTPLMSLTMTAAGLKSRLPSVLDPQDVHRDGILQAIGRLQADLAHVGSSIDLLVANSKDPKSARQEIFDLTHAVRESVGRFPFEPAHQDIVTIEASAPLHVLGNAQLFELVITNLTKNALEAIKRAGKGRILIRCEMRGSEVFVLFRDTGPGVPAHVLARMFQPFFSYPAHRGTGIGLAFCRDVLRSWGASISCRSVEHEFTEFALQFPRPKP